MSTSSNHETFCSIFSSKVTSFLSLEARSVKDEKAERQALLLTLWPGQETRYLVGVVFFG